MGDRYYNISIAACPSDDTLNRGPLALLMRRDANLMWSIIVWTEVGVETNIIFYRSMMKETNIIFYRSMMKGKHKKGLEI